MYEFIYMITQYLDVNQQCDLILQIYAINLLKEGMDSTGVHHLECTLS